MPTDVNLQETLGAAGVKAVNSRHVAARLSSAAAASQVDEKKDLFAIGCLRCCNCGFPVNDSLKLPVYDLHDPISPARKTDDGVLVPGRDYVRIPLDWDELRNPSFEYAPYVACTVPCGLRHMYDSTHFRPAHVPHLYHIMLSLRHRIDEPAVPAPCPQTLEYVNGDRKRGLSRASFYALLSNINLLGYRQVAPAHIPPMEHEQTALQRNDVQFTKYYYQDLMPGCVLASLGLPPEFEDGGAQLDANPDTDSEIDFATDTVHPPDKPFGTQPLL
jgi:hypothetical protein